MRAEEARGEPRLTNYDVLFLIKLLNAHMQDMYLAPGKGESHDQFLRYQQDVLLKLRALDLDEAYAKRDGSGG